MATQTFSDKLPLALSTVIKRRREEVDISQRQLAVKSGLNRSYISDVELGARNLSVRNLSRLALALKSKPSELLARAEKLLNSKKR